MEDVGFSDHLSNESLSMSSLAAIVTRVYMELLLTPYGVLHSHDHLEIAVIQDICSK